MMQKKLSSAQRRKKEKLARKIHAKIANPRAGALHKASTQIARENQVIVLGNFGAKSFTKTKMAKSINDAGASVFRTMLKNKAMTRGHTYIELSKYLTTQICSSGHKVTASSSKGVKDLRVRERVCDSY